MFAIKTYRSVEMMERKEKKRKEKKIAMTMIEIGDRQNIHV